MSRLDFLRILILASILLRKRLTFGLNYGRISSVVRHNTDAVVAQLDRALGYGPRCREFESSRPHTLKLSNLLGSFFCAFLQALHTCMHAIRASLLANESACMQVYSAPARYEHGAKRNVSMCSAIYLIRQIRREIQSLIL